MAGLLGHQFQVPEQYREIWDKLSPVLPYLGQTLNPAASIGGAVAGEIPKFFAPQSQGLPQSQFDERFGAAQQPPQPAPAPQMQSPQGASQMFGLPTGSYEFGQQMVPTYGQPQAPASLDAASAQRRGGAGGVSGVQINPQGNPVAPAAVTPGATETGQDKWMEFLDRLSPDYVSRYRQTKQQQTSARNLAQFFQGQGMNPQQAAALAAVAAQNPKIMEEFFKQPATVEGALARDMAFGTGGGRGTPGGAAQRALDWTRSKEAAQEEGKKSGAMVVEKAELQRSLPSFVNEAKEHIRLVEELRNHPGRKQVGWHDFLGSAPLLPSSKGFDANRRLEQIKGGAFLEAFKALKGGGQITEIEGKKATDAIARMDRASSEREFNQALDDYTGAITRGLEKLQRQAGAPADTSALSNDGWTMRPGNVRIRRIGD